MPITKRKKKRARNWLDQLGREGARQEEERERTPLAPVYFLLIGIIIAAVVVSIVWRNLDVVDRFGANLATETLGILLTVVFVRRFLEQNERSRRLRASIGALRKARRALGELTDTWATLIKGSLPQRPAEGLGDLRDLCSPDQSDALLWLDTSARTPSEPSELWLTWAARRLRSALAALDAIIGTYGGTLDPEYVEALDAVVDDPFTRLVEELADASVDAQKWRVTLNTARSVRSTHFDRLLQILKLHNQLSKEAAAVRAKGIGPRSETLGVELSPDHDLRLETRLEEAWWKRRPTPGSLRIART
ncbi:MAG: hypothetical protein ACRENP_24445 [Longimicrobiales bacterium]